MIAWLNEVLSEKVVLYRYKGAISSSIDRFACGEMVFDTSRVDVLFEKNDFPNNYVFDASAFGVSLFLYNNDIYCVSSNRLLSLVYPLAVCKSKRDIEMVIELLQESLNSLWDSDTPLLLCNICKVFYDKKSLSGVVNNVESSGSLIKV